MIIWHSMIWQSNMVFRHQAATSSAGSYGTTKHNKRKTYPLRKTLCCQAPSSLSQWDRILVAGSLLSMQTRDRSLSTSATRETTGSSSASHEQLPKRLLKNAAASLI